MATVINPPEHFEQLEGYARFQPVGEHSLPEAVELISQAIDYSHGREIPKLLVNTTRLTGIYQPGITMQYRIICRWASLAKGLVKVALVLRPDVIGPGGFGSNVAFTIGLRGNAFILESEALKWLLAD
jgi:hypothetical protein